jgi:hypothetical protein
MIYLESFSDFFNKKKKEDKKEFKGKRDTYRFSNIYEDEKGNRKGDCKNCGEKDVDVVEHGDDCLKK